jgi:hypothetical protein
MIIRYILKYMIDISAYVISYVGPLGCTVAISNTLLHHLVNSAILPRLMQPNCLKAIEI